MYSRHNVIQTKFIPDNQFVNNLPPIELRPRHSRRGVAASQWVIPPPTALPASMGCVSTNPSKLGFAFGLHHWSYLRRGA